MASVQVQRLAFEMRCAQYRWHTEQESASLGVWLAIGLHHKGTAQPDIKMQPQIISTCFVQNPHLG